MNGLLKANALRFFEDLKAHLRKSNGVQAISMERVNPPSSNTWPYLKIQSSNDKPLKRVADYITGATNLPLEIDRTLSTRGVYSLKLVTETADDFLKTYTKIEDYLQASKSNNDSQNEASVTETQNQNLQNEDLLQVDSRPSLRTLFIKCGCRITSDKGSHIHTWRPADSNIWKLQIYNNTIDQADRTLSLLELLGCSVDTGAQKVTSLIVTVRPNINFATMYQEEYTKYFPKVETAAISAAPTQQETIKPTEAKPVIDSLVSPIIEQKEMHYYQVPEAKNPQFAAVSMLFGMLPKVDQDEFLKQYGTPAIDETFVRNDEREKTKLEIQSKQPEEILTLLKNKCLDFKASIFIRIENNGLLNLKEVTLAEFLQFETE
jgi:hypothetical protein